MRHKYRILIDCNVFVVCSQFVQFYFSQFVQFFLSCFTHYSYFALFLLYGFIWLSFLSPLFFLYNFTGTIDNNIDGNVYSFFNIFSAIFWIRSEPFQLFISQNTIFNVFIVNSLLFYNLFHITNVYSCFCAHGYIRWISSLFTAFIHTKITTTWFSFFLDVPEVFSFP